MDKIEIVTNKNEIGGGHWFLNGKEFLIDVDTVIHISEKVEWRINGVKFSKEDFWKLLEKMVDDEEDEEDVKEEYFSYPIQVLCECQKCKALCDPFASKRITDSWIDSELAAYFNYTCPICAASNEIKISDES